MNEEGRGLRLHEGPDRKGHIIPDPQTASVVQLIYVEFLAHQNLHGLARLLKEKQILRPGAYNEQQNGQAISDPEHRFCWGLDTLRDILHNREYTGCTVAGKTHKPSFKSKKAEQVPREQWVITPGTHCWSFRHYGKTRCTPHSNSQKVLDTIVLAVLRQVTAEAREHEQDFVDAVLSASARKAERIVIHDKKPARNGRAGDRDLPDLRDQGVRKTA